MICSSLNLLFLIVLLPFFSQQNSPFVTSTFWGSGQHDIPKYNCDIMVDSCIFSVTLKQMPFIQFPFIEVPKELHELVGEPTPGTRAYRREGSHAQCAEWFEALGEYYRGDVGLSTNVVVLFVPVSRAGVHKRIK